MSVPGIVPCLCPALPVNRWRREGEPWSAELPISGDGGGDAARFAAEGWAQWIIVCPMCGLVYGTGGPAVDRVVNHPTYGTRR